MTIINGDERLLKKMNVIIMDDIEKPEELTQEEIKRRLFPWWRKYEKVKK